MRRRTMLWSKGHTNAGRRTVEGWPTEITNPGQYTIYPACTVATTLDKAMEFQKRAIAATLDLTVTNAGGTTTDTIALKKLKNWDDIFPVGRDITEKELISGYKGPFYWKPWWYGEPRSISLGDEGQSLTWNMEMHSEYLWFDRSSGIAFMDLQFAASIAYREGPDFADFTSEFGVFDTLPVGLPAGNDGTLTMMGAEFLLHGVEQPAGPGLDPAYSFSLDNLVFTDWLPHAKSDGSDPIWDDSNGDQLRSTNFSSIFE